MWKHYILIYKFTILQILLFGFISGWWKSVFRFFWFSRIHELGGSLYTEVVKSWKNVFIFLSKFFRQFSNFLNFVTPSLIWKTILSIIKKLECSQIYKFLHFKMIGSSSSEKNHLWVKFCTVVLTVFQDFWEFINLRAFEFF